MSTCQRCNGLLTRTAISTIPTYVICDMCSGTQPPLDMHIRLPDPELKRSLSSVSSVSSLYSLNSPTSEYRRDSPNKIPIKLTPRSSPLNSPKMKTLKD